MEICKAPALRLKALNGHNMLHIMYIEMANVTSDLTEKRLTHNVDIDKGSSIICESLQTVTLRLTVSLGIQREVFCSVRRQKLLLALLSLLLLLLFYFYFFLGVFQQQQKIDDGVMFFRNYHRVLMKIF